MSKQRHALAKIRAEVKARWWITEGRGSYEWDDVRYRDETRWALEAIDKLAEEGLQSALLVEAKT